MRVYEVRSYIEDFINEIKSLNDPRIKAVVGYSNAEVEFNPNPYLKITADFNINLRLGWVNFNGDNKYGKWNSWVNADGNNALSPEMWANVLTNCINLMQ